MYVKKTDLTVIVYDNQQYTDSSGVQHSKQSDKSEIEELALITEVSHPADTSTTCCDTPFCVELIEGVYIQVWTVRDKTDAEIIVDKNNFLSQIDAQQRDILTIWDGWASKSKAHEDDAPWVDVTRYETAKAWSKTVRAVNDTLSVDSDISVLEAALVTLATLKETGKNI